MQKTSVKKNVFYSVLRAFFRLVFPLITFPYASRILLPEGIGKVNFANSITTYFHLIALLGIEGYAIREASKIKDDKEELSKFTQEILIINTVSMIISYALLFVSIAFIPRLQESKNLLFVCGTSIFFSTIGIDWLFYAREEFKYTTITTVIFQFVGLIYLFLFVKTKDDYLNYAVFSIITTVGRNICNIFYSRKFVDYKIRRKPEIKRHLKYVFTFFGMTLITGLYETLDTTVLGFLSTDVEIGYYSAAIKINRIILGLLAAVAAVLLPRLVTYKEQHEDEKFNSLASESVDLIIMLAMPIVLGLISVSYQLIVLFCGNNYIPAIPAMNIISPIVLAMAVSGITGGQILPSINKEKITLISCLCGAIINFTLNCILIPSYGAKGAAVGSVIAEYVVMLMQVIYLRKLLFSRTLIINLSESMAASFLMFALITFFARRNAQMNILIQLIISIAIGITSYFVLLLVMQNKLLKKYLAEFKSKIIR